MGHATATIILSVYLRGRPLFSDDSFFFPEIEWFKLGPWCFVSRRLDVLCSILAHPDPNLKAYARVIFEWNYASIFTVIIKIVSRKGDEYVCVDQKDYLQSIEFIRKCFYRRYL